MNIELDLREDRDGGYEVIQYAPRGDRSKIVAHLPKAKQSEALAVLFSAAPRLQAALLEVYRRINLREVPGGSAELGDLVDQALSEAERLE